MKNIITKYVVPAGVFADVFKQVHNVYCVGTIVKLHVMFNPTSTTGVTSVIYRLVNDEDGLPAGLFLPMLANGMSNIPSSQTQAPKTNIQFLVKPTSKRVAFYRTNSASSTCGGILHVIEEYDMQFQRGEFH